MHYSFIKKKTIADTTIKKTAIPIVEINTKFKIVSMVIVPTMQQAKKQVQRQ
jgi:hypothetical protein